jgi:hypothetical protein
MITTLAGKTPQASFPTDHAKGMITTLAGKTPQASFATRPLQAFTPRP